MVRLVLIPGLALALAACVPTTRYNYVPLTAENVAEANAASMSRDIAIPLVYGDVGICLASGETMLVDFATLQDGKFCAHTGYGSVDQDGIECFEPGEVLAVGIPYMSKSVQSFPMVAALKGKCDPDDFR